MNRFIFHTFVHQPWMDLKPGMTMGPHGFQNNRHNTWYQQSRGWVEYLARSQSLLQQGTFQADLCYYAGESAPLSFAARWEMTPVPPDGYDYDTCSRDTLMKFQVKDGRLVLPGGMEYRLLVLPDGPMRVETLRKVRDLVRAGAHVVEAKPGSSPGLQNYPQCDEQIRQLADEVWGACDGKTVTENTFGQGKVYWAQTLAPVLAALNLRPDVELKSSEAPTKTLYSGSGFEWIHRRADGAEIYFVSNQQDAPRSVEALFRVGNRTVQLWNPYTGNIEPAPVVRRTEDGRTAVRLLLERAGSVFVVFREGGETRAVSEVLRDGRSVFQAQSPTASLNVAGDSVVLTAQEPGRYELVLANGERRAATVSDVPAPLDLSRDWTVRFPPGWGAPAETTFDRLMSWPEHPDPEIKHFSGTAVYEKRFDAPPELRGEGRAAWLNLGDVQVMAEVILNGENLGILWKPPFDVDVTGKLKAQGNRLEVRVVNLWVNRLIGDAQYPDSCEWTDTGPKHGPGIKAIPDWLLKGQPRPATQQKTFVTWKFYSKDDPLVKSGLIGPVMLRGGSKVKL